ncbi:hypothetical protein FXF69_39320 [Actinomadura chibensis]|uniref:Uncharacterized protein n=1 Tax=Actinomadura chibensis TaxID=392828 RepID=A0A5D0N6H4_9ACTN|nr:hypothetical protein FXF69_39320 [Actinomadura chibensis]
MPGARCPVPGARCPVPGARCPVPGAGWGGAGWGGAGWGGGIGDWFEFGGCCAVELGSTWGSWSVDGCLSVA